MDLTNPCPPEGTDFYYATLFYPRTAQRTLHVLEALRREIYLVPINCNDNTVRTAKLLWWRDEIDMVAVGKQRHPLSQALDTSKLQIDDFKTVFSNFVEEIIAGLARKNSETFKERKDLTARIHGPIANFMLSASSENKNNQPNRYSELASLIELSYELCNFRFYRKLPSLVIPNEELTKYSLNETQARSTLKSAILKPIFFDLATELSGNIERLLDKMTISEKKSGKMLTILAKIRLEVLRRNIREGCPILEKKIELTPLRKLWIAWHTSKFG